MRGSRIFNPVEGVEDSVLVFEDWADIAISEAEAIFSTFRTGVTVFGRVVGAVLGGCGPGAAGCDGAQEPRRPRSFRQGGNPQLRLFLSLH